MPVVFRARGIQIALPILMSKAPGSVIGVDLGRYTLKSVLLQRRGDRVALTNYAVREMGEGLSRRMRSHSTSSSCSVTWGGARRHARLRFQVQIQSCALSSSRNPSGNAARRASANGRMVLNQECKDFVLDCDLLHKARAPLIQHPRRPRPGFRKQPAEVSRRRSSASPCGHHRPGISKES